MSGASTIQPLRVKLDKLRRLYRTWFHKPGNKGRLNKLPSQYNPTYPKWRDELSGTTVVPRLAIVIPVLNGLKKLEDTLVSVLANRPAGCEIIVVLNEPYDDPYQLRGEVCFVDAARDACLVESICAGLAACRAPIVHILSCGMEVASGWCDVALPHFIDPGVAAVAPLVIERLERRTIISAGVSYRPSGETKRLGFGKPIGEALGEKEEIVGADIIAAFYRRSALEAVGGLASAIGANAAGVDLTLALHFAGYRSVCEPKCKMYLSLEDVEGGRRVAGGRAAERLFWTWAPQIGTMRSISQHLLLVFEEFCESVVRPATFLRLCGRAYEALLTPLRRRNVRNLINHSSAGHPLAPPHFSTAKRRSVTCE
jgi:hypothetical protein